ncbi:MAG: (2Fe-2S) ferredoxin domain-containing protein [Lentisphaerota bacterium]
MDQPDYHIFVCNSFRLSGEPQGLCNKKGSVDLLQFLENEIAARGLNAIVTSSGCLKACEKGPVMVVYPGAWWYGELNEERIDTLLDALEKGEPAPDLLLS